MKKLTITLLGAALLAAGTAHADRDDRDERNNQGINYANLNLVQQEIAQLFDRWNRALQTGKPGEVAKLYARKGGTLLPTVSNVVRTNRAAIQDYFEHFLALKPYGRIDQSNIRVLDEDTAIDSGVYTFEIVRDGKPDKVQARYSFLYEKIDGTWYIMDHHSSAMPEKAAPAAPSH
ncbi:SgcJ/EcaC family oxidoreductase [Chitiniphilus purpureus]|uniref:SgcJ/EcaC family oxidoreductase n=1 Tax=Chitiniphilus purpureus TaxID=2981137 RepID=A0ABY6DHD5_9NEIS|nr:SgcJ/EcaC family oxidoreductase [Chitiniphilus sp. CD1]UXY13760.1 SgcJ/EcaC family oxidoreductase [Chitiniphilus sp. CD1]